MVSKTGHRACATVRELGAAHAGFGDAALHLLSSIIMMANRTLANVALSTGSCPASSGSVGFSGADQRRHRFLIQNEQIPMGSFLVTTHNRSEV
jgi:hypothetical protein